MESHHNLHHIHNLNNNYSPTSLNNHIPYNNHVGGLHNTTSTNSRSSNCGESNRSEEVDDFSESDCEKDIDICCDEDNKVTSSSAETPVSVKEEFDDECCEEERDSICSPGGADRISPGILSSPDNPIHSGNDDSSSHNHHNAKSNNNNNNNNSSSSGNQQNSRSSSGKKSSKTPKVKVEMKGRCNCDELSVVNCHLETKDLWDKFHDLGTEMIITKTGRYAILIL